MISRMTIVHRLAVAALYHWPLHRLDIKNTFFMVIWWNLYMGKPTSFVDRGELGLVCKL